MRVLLLGEYSNLHYTLARALREEGHEVRLVSDGDDWKGFQQDICLRRNSTGLIDTLTYLFRLWKEMRHWHDYDVVQLINPVHFIELKAGRGIRIYDHLRKRNRKVFLGAFGDDYYYIRDSYEHRPLRYCDFYTSTHEVRHEWNTNNITCWLHDKAMVHSCTHIATTCDGIISALYEYHLAYQHTDDPTIIEKETFIPLPIWIENESMAIDSNQPEMTEKVHDENEAKKKIRPQREHACGSTATSSKIKFFIGIQRLRSKLKGTDILLSIARNLQEQYPDRMELIVAENLPFNDYIHLLSSCDILLDQIYSYTPAMNALQAMARGVVAVSGGEEEQYALLGENVLRPIVNVQPDEADIHARLEYLILHPEVLAELKEQSKIYVRRHHDAHIIAHRYIAFWQSR